MDKPQPLQPEELKAIEARCEAATPGPWGRGCLDEEMVYATTEIASTGENGPLVAETYAVNASSDADFIAHARTDIPRLLATIEEARREQPVRVTNLSDAATEGASRAP